MDAHTEIQSYAGSKNKGRRRLAAGGCGGGGSYADGNAGSFGDAVDCRWQDGLDDQCELHYVG